MLYAMINGFSTPKFLQPFMISIWHRKNVTLGKKHISRWSSQNGEETIERKKKSTQIECEKSKDN